MKTTDLRDAVRDLATRAGLWTGDSGEHLTGAEIADHLTRAVDRLERTGWDPDRGWGIYRSLADTSPGEADVDTRYAASRLLDMVLKVRTGAARADFEAWEAKQGRALSEVVGLLRQAADIARACDSAGGAS